MKTLVVPLLFAGLMTGVALSPSANATPRSNSSIWIGGYGSISSWRAVARDELNLWSGPSRAYLVKVWRPATSLRSGETIGHRRTAGRLTKFDSIYTRGQRLPIKFIQRIDPQIAKSMSYRHM